MAGLQDRNESAEGDWSGDRAEVLRCPPALPCSAGAPRNHTKTETKNMLHCQPPLALMAWANSESTGWRASFEGQCALSNTCLIGSMNLQRCNPMWRRKACQGEAVPSHEKAERLGQQGSQGACRCPCAPFPLPLPHRPGVDGRPAAEWGRAGSASPPTGCPAMPPSKNTVTPA